MQQITNSKGVKTEINQYENIVIRKNNKNNIVIMSEEYRNKIIDEKIERKILESEEDYNTGRVKKAEDVFREWEIKYGI